MKQQVEAFETAFLAFDQYAQILLDAVHAISSGDKSEDLIVSLMRDEKDQLAPGIADRLEHVARKTATLRPRISQLLASEKGVDARQTVIAEARSLDRQLEMALDLQSPAHARVPQPYRFFQPVSDRMNDAFPRNIGDPVQTPTVMAFQRFLESPENPWRV